MKCKYFLVSFKFHKNWNIPMNAFSFLEFVISISVITGFMTQPDSGVLLSNANPRDSVFTPVSTWNHEVLAKQSLSQVFLFSNHYQVVTRRTVNVTLSHHEESA